MFAPHLEGSCANSLTLTHCNRIYGQGFKDAEAGSERPFRPSWNYRQFYLRDSYRWEVEPLFPHLRNTGISIVNWKQEVVLVEELSDAIFLESKSNLCPQLFFPCGLNVAVCFLALAALISHGKWNAFRYCGLQPIESSVQARYGTGPWDVLVLNQNFR